MANLADPEGFALLTELAEPMMERARVQMQGRAIGWAGEDEETRVLEEETGALGLSFQALAHVSPLEPGALVLALAATVGGILAQCDGCDHGALTKAFQRQMVATYEEVSRAHVPVGTAQ